MCYANGSIEQVTRSCVMCKVTPPRLGCPHQPLGLCRNRQNHPRFDVVHFHNAELDLFNGCGYCKWAKKHASSIQDKHWYNSGFPGCCRPPKSTEWNYIKSSTEWIAISLIHGTPIPPEALSHHSSSSSSSPPPPPPRNSKRSSGKSSPPIPISIPHDNKDKDFLVVVSPTVSSLLDSSFTAEAACRTPRRKSNKLPPPDRNLAITSQSVPIRNYPTSAMSSLSTISVNDDNKSGIKHVPSSRARRSLDDGSGSIRRRPSLVNLTTSGRVSTVSGSGSDPTSIRSGRSTIDTATVTSDGFTDYLSDESDQELQRQAEIRAAELEQAKQEKAEFDAALQTVRHLCLQPPPEWNNTPSLHESRPKVPRNPSLSSFPVPPLLSVTIGHSRR